MMDSENFTSHISKRFNSDLVDLKNQLLLMGGLVQQQVRDAVQALVDLDSMLAEQVRNKEKQVNTMELSLDNECTEVLVLRQPAAGDLRMVVAVSRSIADLERIGDESNKIAKLALQLAEQGQSPRGCIEVRHIGQHVAKMLHNALDAFARFDVEMALAVAQEDKFVDMEYEAAMRQLVTYMIEDPRSITRVLNVVWALRALERIGDHAGNIAEHLIYLVKGTDIRHVSLDSVIDKVLGPKPSADI
jgi:phosphate transport system protein